MSRTYNLLALFVLPATLFANDSTKIKGDPTKNRPGRLNKRSVEKVHNAFRQVQDVQVKLYAPVGKWLKIPSRPADLKGKVEARINGGTAKTTIHGAVPTGFELKGLSTGTGLVRYKYYSPGPGGKTCEIRITIVFANKPPSR